MGRSVADPEIDVEAGLKAMLGHRDER